MKVWSDWNRLRADGTLPAIVRHKDELPEVGATVWAYDSGEKVRAVVISVGEDSKHGTRIVVKPDWATQRDA